MGTELSRRSFITGAVAVGGAAAMAGLTGCGGAVENEGATSAADGGITLAEGERVWGSWRVAPDPIPDDQIKGTAECDVLVVGGGITGLPAACYAAEQGLKTVVLEKGGRYGQHRLCTCAFGADVQTRVGLTFDRKDIITEAWKISNGYQGMIRHYCRWYDNSADYVNWLEGVFTSKGWALLPMAGGGQADAIIASLQNIWWPGVPSMVFFVDDNGQMYATGGNPDWTGLLHEYAVEKGADFRANTPAVQLIRDEASGRITGAVARDEVGDYYRFSASKGVIMATGDIGADRDMLMDLNPSLALRVHQDIVETKNTGDGHKMGVWIGAGMDESIAGDMFPFTVPYSGNEINRMGVRPVESPQFSATRFIMWRPAVGNLPVLMVDSQGRRIAAEDLPFQAFCLPSLSTADGRVWSIWDGAWETKLAPYPSGDIMSVNTQEQVDKEVEAGVTKKFDSIDELIEGVGLDAEVFGATLERYNTLCAAGDDVDCFKTAKWMTTIDTPPFYAAVHGAGLDSTRGGLKVDDRQHVLDTEGKVIPGLYAVGNVAGSFYGNVYPPNIMGSGIGHGQCFGWLAVKDILGQEIK